jgi:phage tail-like protein
MLLMDEDKDQFSNEYPPPSFHFKVVFTSQKGRVDTSFQDVSGISATLTAEETTQGGENSSNIFLPKSIDYSNLVLKRGIAPLDSPLATWCSKVLHSDLAEPIIPTDVLVYLLNEERSPMRAWCFVRAYPVKWSVDAFNSTKNDVAIETIELKYHHFYRMM